MRVLMSCGLILATAACSNLPPKITATNTAVTMGALSSCRFDFTASGGANAICLSGDTLVDIALPACPAGKPKGPLVQAADSKAVFSENSCVSSFGGQKWLVAKG